jgi:hypothetical protein
VSTGLSEVIGSWKIIAMSLPRILRISASLFLQQVLAAEEHRAASILPGGIGISRMMVSA